MKVIIHPGFHKTGTTTLQKTLAKNRAALENDLSFFIPADMKEVGFLARRMAVDPKKGKLKRLRQTFLERLELRGGVRDKNVLISCEELCGLIPGRKDVWSYHQAPEILKVIVEASRDFFGEGSQHVVFFTTREVTSWCRSTYWQNLRSNRITSSLDEYQDKLLSKCDLHVTIESVRQALCSEAIVKSIDVTECRHRLGSLGEMLDELSVRSEHLDAVENLNVQPQIGAETLLRLNCSDLTDEELSSAKRSYLDSLHVKR